MLLGSEKIFSSVKNFIYKISYYKEARRNFYAYRLSGKYRLDENGDFYVEIKTFGSPHMSFIQVKDVFEKTDFLSGFSPYDVSRISLLAYYEISSSLEDPKKKMKELIEHMFNELME